MTKETQKEIVKMLFDRNSELFFDKLESVEKYDENNPFIVGEYGTDSMFKPVIARAYELKDEFKESLSKLSLSEMLQLANLDDTAPVKTDVNVIKKWVIFFGIIAVINIIFSLIMVIGGIRFFSSF